MIEELQRLLGNERLRCVDVGARGGIPAQWRPFAAILDVDAFEPDEAACRLQQEAHRPGERWYPLALGEHSGTGRLHVLKKASSSSLYPPNPAENARYDYGGIGEVVRIAEIPLHSLSDVLDRENRTPPHLMKLDTQGTELGILRGIQPRHWDSLLAIQTETHFVEFYLGEPLFHDLDAFMRSRGFILFDLLPVRKYRTGGTERHHYLKRHLGIARNRIEISQRITGGDVFYIRPPEAILEAGDRLASLRMLAILLIYRCLDEALWMIEAARDRRILTGEEAASLIRLVRRRAPTPLPWQRTGAVGKWARRILKALGISKRRKIEYWLDRSWDN